MLGKYFNEYPYHPGGHLSDAEKAELRSFVPPGWQSWASPVQGNAYAQDHYRSTSTARSTPTSTRTTWTRGSATGRSTWSTARDGFDFAEGGQFVYYASYSPHTPYAYPKELKGTFADAQYPRTPDFDEADVSDKFGLTRTRKALSASDIATIDETFRKRIRSVQVLDQNVAELVQALDDQGALDNTYLIFTSDNGYIMGNHRREIGKYNQFQGDRQRAVLRPRPGHHARLDVRRRGRQHRHRPDHRRDRRAPAPPTSTASRSLPRLHGGPPLARASTSCSAGR